MSILAYLTYFERYFSPYERIASMISWNFLPLGVRVYSTRGGFSEYCFRAMILFFSRNCSFFCKCPRAYADKRCFELTKTFCAVFEMTDNKERPGVANKVCHSCDRA